MAIECDEVFPSFVSMDQQSNSGKSTSNHCNVIQIKKLSSALSSRKASVHEVIVCFHSERVGMVFRR